MHETLETHATLEQFTTVPMELTSLVHAQNVCKPVGSMDKWRRRSFARSSFARGFLRPLPSTKEIKPLPITQHRMVSLINILDETLSGRETLCRLATLELEEATTEFYATNGNENLLASSLLARLQNLAAAILDNPRGMSQASLETLTREREHFRLRQAQNSRAAQSMRRTRDRRSQPNV